MALIRLHISDLKRNSYDIDVSMDINVLEMKQQIASQYNFENPSNIKLIFNKRVLNDEQSLESLGLFDGATLKLFYSTLSKGSSPQPSSASNPNHKQKLHKPNLTIHNHMSKIQISKHLLSHLINLLQHQT